MSNRVIALAALALALAAFAMEVNSRIALHRQIEATVDQLEAQRSQPVMAQLNKGRQLMELEPLAATNYSEVLEAIMQTSVSTLNSLTGTNGSR